MSKFRDLLKAGKAERDKAKRDKAIKEPNKISGPKLTFKKRDNKPQVKLSFKKHLNINKFDDFIPMMMMDKDKEERVKSFIREKYIRGFNYSSVLSRPQGLVFHEEILRATTFNQLRTKMLAWHTRQNSAYKLNIKFGFVGRFYTKDKVTGEEIEVFEYFHPGETTRLFTSGNPKPGPIPYKLQVISKRSDFEGILANYVNEKVFRFISERTVDFTSGMSVLGITSVILEASYLNQAMGDGQVVIPKYLQDKKCLTKFADIKHNLCFFACVAKALNPDIRGERCQSRANDLYKQFYNVKGADYKHYAGFQFEEHDHAEEKFGIAINIWEYQAETEECEPIRRSTMPSEAPIVNILQFNNHYMYISNVQTLLGQHQCDECGRFFNKHSNITHHKKYKQCHGKDDLFQKEKFAKESQPYTVTSNNLQKLLQTFDLPDSDYFIDHRAVFDFEASVDKAQSTVISDKTQYLGQHCPISWSVATNIPGMELKTVLLDEVNMSHTELVTQFADYIVKYSIEAQKMTDEKFKPLLDKIYSTHGAMRFRYLQTYYNATRVPVIGYNSSNYDLNMIKDFGFFQHLFTHEDCGLIWKKYGDMFFQKFGKIYNVEWEDDGGDDNDDDVDDMDFGFEMEDEKVKQFQQKAYNMFAPFMIKDGSNYKTVSMGHLKFLDQMAFTPGSLASFIETFNKSAPVGKLAFPHDTFNFKTDLYAPFPPKYEEFYSHLSNSNISQEKYDSVVKIGVERGCQTMRDFLRLYNECDVVPFLETCLIYSNEIKIQKNIDVYATCLGAPTLAIQSLLMCAFDEKNFSEFKKNWVLVPNESLTLPPYFIQQKIRDYTSQDVKAGRITSISEEHVQSLFKKQGGCCYTCHKLVHLTDLTLDRVNNELGHIDGNMKITCNPCNCTRKKGDIDIQRANNCRREFERSKPQLWVFGEKQKEAFYIYKQKGITGGPSIVFHRHHKRNETQIQHIKYDEETSEWGLMEAGKFVKAIISFDANALYPWAYGFNDMPCGEVKITKDPKLFDTLKDVITGKAFGFVLCDIHVPKKMYDYFAEFPPLFANKEINGVSKLSSFMSLTNGLLATELVRWYLKKGLEITKIHELHEYTRGQPFRAFVEQVADDRRKGGAHDPIAKICSNSCFGKFGQNNNKHKNFLMTSDEEQAKKRVNEAFYNSGSEMMDQNGNRLFEVFSTKKSVKQNMPLHGASMIYQLAKLRMLQFYYDCVDRFIDRSDFQLMYMDTDSNWLAFSKQNPFKTLIKPEMRQQWELEKHTWLALNKYDEKTPGLFKVEYEADEMVALCSKMYIASPLNIDDETLERLYNGDVINIDHLTKLKGKMGSKGVQKRNRLDVEMFTKALYEDVVYEVENQGFKPVDGKTITYNTVKRGVHNTYNKRTVAENKINTFPIEY
jgi:hypothetical protein